MKLPDGVRRFFSSLRPERERLAELYRPLARGSYAVIAAYYALAAVVLGPLTEEMSRSLFMLPLRLLMAGAGAAAFVFSRRTRSLARLELFSLGLNLTMALVLTSAQAFSYHPEVLFNFVMVMVVAGLTSPSARILLLSLLATLCGWFGLALAHPNALSQSLALAAPGVAVALLIWGLMSGTLRQAAQAMSALEQRNEELARFTHICSHDMQEPVRMMNAYAEFLQESMQARLDDDGRRYLDYIRSNARRLRAMIGDILAFSSIGRDAIALEQVDSAALVADIVAGLAPDIAARGAEIEVDDLPRLKTSPVLLRMVFQNLIINALKYQAADRPPRIRISARRDKANWRFEVADNGIGIESRHRDQVFALFQRLNRKEDYAGSGIGLSSCRKFLHICGGEIDFDSTPGEGSTFFFTLPI